MRYKCKKCNYEWDALVKKPKQCPRCKRYDYNMEKVENITFPEEIKKQVATSPKGFQKLVKKTKKYQPKELNKQEEKENG